MAGELKFANGKSLQITTIYCIGLNYFKHAEECKLPTPEYPVLFMKPITASCGNTETVKLPCDKVDYEAELAVVIGKTCKNVSEKEAMDYVSGYTAANDLSARDWQVQKGGTQWVRGKSFDGFCPLGPNLLTPEEIGDPHNLRVQTRLNGQTMQDGNTNDFIFNIPKIISFISQETTLLPGTVILTGTPPGVGAARDPPIFLKPGDQVEIEIEKIGVLKTAFN
eukprot:TRINITY_DN49839_c0_g1_i1.p1 TRINITY_DN49839_c0_g1~~TRINITY_DN49839_c0_g1_i1.p1  ORF type:complete len:223 (-),score=19.93 TRINITY_DN49839_c0_g1_i1:75-743(-)